jgi:HAD superfamily hydrolase (TIGR01509 family)
MKIAHLGLMVNNLYTMQLFYTRALGFRKSYYYESRNTPGLTVVFLVHDTVSLELLHYSGKAETKTGKRTGGKNHNHLALWVPDVDKQAARLQRLGVTVVRGPRTTGDGYRELEIADPEGNIIEFSRRVAPPPRYPVRAVIFDLDGTVIDSEDNYHEADRLLLAHYGIEFTREMKNGFIGMGNYSMMEKIKRRYNLPDSVEQMTAVKNSHYLELALKNTAVFGRMLKLIKKLHHKGMPLALATGSSPEVVHKLTSLLRIDRYFRVCLSADDVGKSKPEPDLFLETARRLGLESRFCLVIEDSKFGVEAAARAHMRCIAIPSVIEDPPADAFFTADLLFKQGMKQFNYRKTYRWIMRRSQHGNSH